jgi:toxin ParE1/3/4
MVGPKYRLVWSKEAEQDLLAIWRFGADEWSPSTADHYIADLFRTCLMLLEAPDLGRSRDELLPGVRSIPLGPHTIFYRVANRGVEIIRVLHQREDIAPIFYKLDDADYDDVA